jgi:hypothetical protein
VGVVYVISFAPIFRKIWRNFWKGWNYWILILD